MDCALFIRSKRVLAAWVATPMLVLLTLHLAVNGFYRHQRISFEQKRALNRMIPEMQSEANASTRFVNSCRISATGSVRDFYIGMLNDAADETAFKIENIYIDQKSLDRELGTAKLVIRLKGSGTLRQTVTFLKNVKEKDPMLLENSLQILSGPPETGLLSLEVELLKVYAE